MIYDNIPGKKAKLNWPFILAWAFVFVFWILVGIQIKACTIPEKINMDKVYKEAHRRAVIVNGADGEPYRVEK